MVVAAAAAVSVRAAPVTPVPEVTVVIVWAAPKPLSPLNVKPPMPPFETLVSVIVGSFVLVNVQAILEPAAVAAAFSASAPVARFGVAVPPVPMPVQAADASA